MNENGFYLREELLGFGFKSLGEDVNISRKASIYGAELMTIGNHVRIDDFCILSGHVKLGHYVHISAWSGLYGRYGIDVGDFCGVSPRSILLSASDDFSGEFMVSPMVPEALTHLTTGTVVLKNYCQVGAGSVVMPGAVFHEGAVCGAMSFVNRSLEAWTVNAGIPCRRLKKRSNRAKELSLTIEDYRRNMQYKQQITRGGVKSGNSENFRIRFCGRGIEL